MTFLEQGGDQEAGLPDRVQERLEGIMGYHTLEADSAMYLITDPTEVLALKLALYKHHQHFGSFPEEGVQWELPKGMDAYLTRDGDGSPIGFGYVTRDRATGDNKYHGAQRLGEVDGESVWVAEWHITRPLESGGIAEGVLPVGSTEGFWNFVDDMGTGRFDVLPDEGEEPHAVKEQDKVVARLRHIGGPVLQHAA